jgi:hypothetical protein
MHRISSPSLKSSSFLQIPMHKSKRKKTKEKKQGAVSAPSLGGAEVVGLNEQLESPIVCKYLLWAPNCFTGSDIRKPKQCKVQLFKVSVICVIRIKYNNRDITIIRLCRIKWYKEGHRRPGFTAGRPRLPKTKRTCYYHTWKGWAIRRVQPYVRVSSPNTTPNPIATSEFQVGIHVLHLKY